MTHFFSSITKQFKSITGSYTKCSPWGKVVIFTILLMLLIMVFKDLKSGKLEGFEQGDKFLFKSGDEIYDDFYADIYDYLVFNNLKDEYEVGEIMNKTGASSQSKVLDIGCGTGHHVASMKGRSIDIVGIDISPSMIKKAKENYPDYQFQVADATNSQLYPADSFTHILCMYFTIYYIQDKNMFLHNCYNWLMPGGYLILHLVDRINFDPILPPGNPLLYVSPQKYATKRITHTNVKFTDFAYNANFELDEQNNIAKFTEKFKNDKDGKVRKQEHVMYMPDLKEIVDEVQSTGFIVESIIDLVQCQYEYQYLYIFTKPN
jgi:Methylase involved in ubiquinone/menaquinone biosynthesis